MCSSIATYPLVKQGYHHHPVPTLQYLLRAHGHTIAVDGSFGPKTYAAVIAFQKSKHLTPDGIVGPITWGALIIQVSEGSTGDAVRGVQEESHLERTGGPSGPVPPLTVDGNFGPVTDAWVRAFQKDAETADDGIVGPITWRALIGGREGCAG